MNKMLDMSYGQRPQNLIKLIAIQSIVTFTMVNAYNLTFSITIFQS